MGIALGTMLTACGSGVGPPQAEVDAGVQVDAAILYIAPIVCESTPGNRLKREYIEPSPGARQEYRIIDALHDVECKYQAEDAGAYTCYPLNIDSTAALFFQDSLCTSALARFPVTTEPRKFTREVRAGAMPCGAPIREYRLVGTASPVTGGNDIFERDGLGACVPRVAPNGEYFVAGPALTATDFVGATAQAFSADTRISGMIYAGNDNSQMCASNLLKVDSALSVSCQNRLGADGESYCMPTGGSSESYFSDMLCETVTIVAPVGECESPMPSYVIEDTTGTCGAVTRTVTNVLATEVTERYRVAGPVCQLEAPNTNKYYAVGTAALDSEFANLVLETEEGEGRVKRLVVAAADRSAEFTNLWYDSKLATNCFFAAAGDGSFRCLPFTMPRQTLFTDVDCTIQIDTLAVEQECVGNTGYLAQAGVMGNRIFAARAYAQTVYSLVLDVCTEVAGPVYEEDFEHAATSFPLGEIVLP